MANNGSSKSSNKDNGSYRPRHDDPADSVKSHSSDASRRRRPRRDPGSEPKQTREPSGSMSIDQMVDERVDKKIKRAAELHAAGMDEKIARIAAGLDNVSESQKATKFVTTDPKGRVAKNKRGVETANRRATNLEKRVSALEQLFAGAASGTLDVQTGGGRKSFIGALREQHIDDERIRKVLVILDDDRELDLTDEQLFAELFTVVDSVQSTVADHAGRIRNLEDSHRMLRQEVQQVTSVTSTGFPWIGLGLGVIVGIIVAIIWSLTDPLHYAHESLVVQSCLIGIAAGLVVLAFAFVLARSKSKTITTAEESTDEADDHSNGWWANFRHNYNANRAPHDAATADDTTHTSHAADQTEEVPTHSTRSADHNSPQEANAR